MLHCNVNLSSYATKNNYHFTCQKQCELQRRTLDFLRRMAVITPFNAGKRVVSACNLPPMPRNSCRCKDSCEDTASACPSTSPIYGQASQAGMMLHRHCYN